ncbi:acetyltransferase-like isoleucine patch superfamily enzyme [Litoreibacter ponti]|uniref:Acetyltransferase-like isoleucine patch superfamily enzyme n=1 Tax=Litoreibacter ponti TaxID=1510457 RepID=A0A2T6BPC3_9RHOB|nr:acyltransferase [Litoreibacter ponti]PTX57929.1 acetyltransferase-like isoleucine patch superfamily enzyme [Litoreibacter ponti]
MADISASLAPAHKPRPTKTARGVRLLLSVFDPRAYLHALRVLNHLNQTHAIPRRRLRHGPGVAISPTCEFAHAERIVLGDRAHIGTRCIIWAGPRNGRITVGNDLLLGPNVTITAANYRFRDGSPVTEQGMDEADVTIGDDVWIGAGAIILSGSSLGHGSIIAAGAVIRGSVPDRAIMAGVPAQQVGTR